VLPEAVAGVASVSHKALVEGRPEASNELEAFLGPELVTAATHCHTGIALERGVREGCNVAHVIALFTATLAFRDTRESFYH
jgi:hypothetical protein